MTEILDVIHNTIYQFLDVCGDDEEAPMTDKDKLLLEVNKAICNNLRALEQEPKWIPVSERLPEEEGSYMTTLDYGEYGLSVGQRFYYGKDYGWTDGHVIAWMPLSLPEPYKPQESEG